MQLNKSKNFMLILFSALYFVQGVIQAYQLNFFKPHMSSEGIDPDRIGLVASLALLPFVIKWIFGIISDRVNLFGYGHRKPYMVIGVTACALAFAGAFFVDPNSNYGAVAAMVLLATFFMAFFDTTADALAVDVTPPEDESLVQSYMTMGRAAGLIILSFIFGLIADRFGFNYIFLVIAICLLFPLYFVLQIEEPARRSESQTFEWGAFRMLLRPTTLLFGLFLAFSYTTFQAIDGLVTFYMSSELGVSATVIGRYGTLKGIGMMIGAVIISVAVRRFGTRFASLLTLAAVTLGGLIFSITNNVNTILMLGVVWGIVVGLHWTVYAAVSMSITDLRVAGSMFAILQTMANVGLGLGDGLAASFADNMSFSEIFRLFALLNLIAIPLFLIFYRSFSREPS